MDRITELVEYVAKALVKDPSQVRVKAVEKDRVVVIELNVGEEDMGTRDRQAGTHRQSYKGRCEISFGQREEKISRGDSGLKWQGNSL